MVLLTSDRDNKKCGHCSKAIPKGVRYFHVGKFGGYQSIVAVHLCSRCLSKICDMDVKGIVKEDEIKYKEYEERVLVRKTAEAL